VSIAFDVPTELKEAFKFMHGQNVTLRTTINEKNSPFVFYICSSPTDELRVAVKKVEDGLFSSANDELKQGELLEVLPPTGRFMPSQSHQSKKLSRLQRVVGSPLFPLSKPRWPWSRIAGLRWYTEIAVELPSYFSELEALKNKYMERFA
jgi:ring-1,2-phenylacetyl-CoA epoxidase subunit PaaE